MNTENSKGFNTGSDKEGSGLETSLLNGLLNSITDSIFFKDKEGVYLGCNSSFCEVLGLEKTQIIGKTDYDLFPKEKADSYKTSDYIVLESNHPKHTEEWVDHPNGKLLLLDTLKSPLLNFQNEVIGLLGVSRDITEKKQIKEMIQKSFNQIKEKDTLQKLIMESAGKAYVLFDLDRNIALINDTFFEMFDLPEEAKNITEEQIIRDLIAEKFMEPKKFIDNTIHVFDSHEKVKEIYELKNGKILEGLHIGRLWIFSNITELKKAEIERQRFFEVSLDLFCIAGDDGYFKTLSPAWASVLGWSEEELKSKPFTEFVHEEDRNSMIEAAKALLEGKDIC